jgi:methylmalonyl-CoA mutase cobalamin-binding domain/chain
MGQFAGAIAGVWRQSVPINKITLMEMSMFSKNQEASNDKSNKTKNNDPAECRTSIQSIIESDILPRLLGSQNINATPAPSSPLTRPLPSAAEIQEFAMICALEEDSVAEDFVSKMLEEGLSKENIFLDLITPTARFLGTQWELDRMDFYLVTHGLARLHTVTHEIGFSYMDGPVLKGEVRRIMIASAPGSEHLLGPTIVSEFFRKEGWQVVMEISPTPKELIRNVHNEWFDAVGLSVSIQAQLTDLPKLISDIKKSSLNPRVALLLGGPIFTMEDFKTTDFGVGGICSDAKDAVALAISLMPND